MTRHPIFSATSGTPTTEWTFRPGAQTTNVRVKARLSVSTIEAALAVVSEGFGIARLMSYQVAPYLRTGKLKTVLTDYEQPPLPIHGLHGEGRYSSAKVRTFVEFVVATLKADMALN